MVSHFLWPYGLQHARLPCLHHFLEFAQTVVHWVSDAIQPFHSLIDPLLLLLSVFPSIRVFSSWVHPSHQVTRVLELELQHQSFQWIFRTLGLTGLISLQSKRLSRVFSLTTVWVFLSHISSSALSFLYGPTHIHPYMTAGKTIALTTRNFVAKVMSLLFNMLSVFVIAFLSRTECLFISWLQSPFTVTLEPRKIKSVIVSIVFPICHEVMGLDAMILVFWMLSFKPTFSLSSHLHQEAL